MMRKITDLGIATLLVAAMALPGWAHAGSVAGDPECSSPAATKDATPKAAAALVPMVTVEIQHQGRVLKSKPERMNWDEPGAIHLERGERAHDVTLAVSRKDGSNKLHVTLTYELDGERVIEDFAYDTKSKKREILRTDGVALAITVRTKPLEGGRPTEREDKLEPDLDHNDPLAGL